MLLCIVQIEHEEWQFHDLEVEHYVPEDCPMLLHEAVFEYNLLSFLLHNVDVFFVQGHRWEKLDTHPLLPFQVLCLMLRVNLELWHEVLFAHGTSDSVGR